jgi:glycosyltransferase involved in cell wall biosynthesis
LTRPSTEGPVRTTVFLPQDPASQRIGGILTFVKGFIKFAPDDFETEVIGTTADERERPLRMWQTVQIEGRPTPFLPLVADRSPHGRPRIPIALRYTLAAVRHRALIGRHRRILQFHRAGVPLAFARDRRPKVQVVHLNVADIYRTKGESRWRLLPGAYHRVEDLTLPSMDRVFVVNRAGAEFYRRRYPSLASRLAFIPTWVDDTMFRAPTGGEREAARRALSDELALAPEPDARFLLFAGRLEAQKDPQLLIEGFAAAQRREPQLRLIIAGDGSLRPAATRAAAQAGVSDRTHFVGFKTRAELATLMQAADAFILTSRFEGMPISSLEALSSGLPVVATAVGELPAVVREGENGSLSAERSVEAVAAAICRVLGRDRSDVAPAAIASVNRYRARTVLGPLYDAHRELWR